MTIERIIPSTFEKFICQESGNECTESENCRWLLCACWDSGRSTAKPPSERCELEVNGGSTCRDRLRRRRVNQWGYLHSRRGQWQQQKLNPAIVRSRDQDLVNFGKHAPDSVSRRRSRSN